MQKFKKSESRSGTSDTKFQKSESSKFQKSDTKFQKTEPKFEKTEPKFQKTEPKFQKSEPQKTQPSDVQKKDAVAGKTDRKEKTEVTVCGVNACLELLKTRPEDVIRISIVQERIAMFAQGLRWCADHKKAYHVVTPADLEKIADTLHHEGICLLAKQRRPITFVELLERVKQAPATEAECIVVLENIQNPHNLGAILRVCAHFGIKTVCVANHKDSPRFNLSPSLYRTSEGGAEHVDVVELDDPVRNLRLLKTAGFTFYAATSHTKKSIYTTALQDRSLFLFGSEGEGLSKALQDLADASISVPGSGNVESLNVACAASVALGEFWRKQSILRSAAARKHEKTPEGRKEKFAERKAKRQGAGRSSAGGAQFTSKAGSGSNFSKGSKPAPARAEKKD